MLDKMVPWKKGKIVIDVALEFHASPYLLFGGVPSGFSKRLVQGILDVEDQVQSMLDEGKPDVKA